nr:LamG-like jellyroll fold domain-containing protein [Streptomyces sp. TLI_235]
MTVTTALAVSAALTTAVLPAMADTAMPSQDHITAATAERAAEQPPAGETEQALAKAKATGQKVAITSLTTEFSETAATPDGHLALTSHPDQQRVKKDDAWTALDASLIANADGTFSPKAAAGALVLSKGGGGPLATMTSADGKKLSLSAPFALPTPSVKGDSLLYPSVAPDIDLKVTATKAGGLTTVLVVRTQAAAANSALKNLHFDTVADGVTVTSDQGGNLTATASDGKPRWLAPTSQMWDSTAPATDTAKIALTRSPARNAVGADSTTDTGATSKASTTSTAEGPGVGAKTAGMPVTATTRGVSLAPDQDLLAHGTAPYFIDPAWVPLTTAANAWTWVQSAHPTTTNGNRTGSADQDHPGAGLCGYYAAGGSCSPSDVYRTFYQFNTSPLHGAVFHYARMDLQEYVSADWSCTNTYPLDLYLTGAIDGTTSWERKPGPIGGTLGRQWVGGSGHGNCYDNVPFSYDITGTLQQYGGDHDTLTFGLYGDESNQNGFKRFTYQPSLYVEYDRVPNTPTNPGVSPAPKIVSPSQTTQSCGNGISTAWAWLGAGADRTGGVTINSTVSSPIQSQLYTWNHIWDYNLPNAPDVDSGYSPLVASGGDAPFTVKPGVIKDGHSYGYSIMASDQLAGVSWSGATPVCFFKVDTTPPTLSFPGTVSDPATQFPPSGNGQASKIYAGQSGAVPFTAADPNPSGLNTSGLACLRWSWDPQLAGATWQCGAAMPTGQIPNITPGHWGTNILYVQAEDNAGNLSPIAPYAFYVPWNPSGPAPAFGDVTGDGVPDILAPDAGGNLRAYTVPGNPQAGNPTTLLAAKKAGSPGGDSWANYRTTHRGSLRGGMNVDDLIVHKDGAAAMYYYKNPGNTGVPGVFDTKQTIAKPTCAPMAGRPDNCTGYNATDWSTVLQIAALGDPATGSLDTAKKFQNRTGLLTVETNPATQDGTLWFYPSYSDTALAAPIKISSDGWKSWDLISPGDWAGQGHPGLWARNSGNGDLRGYTFTAGTGTYTDPDFGTETSYPIITDIASDAQIVSRVYSTSWPRVGSDGDLTGSTNPTLWGITPAGAVQVWTGERTGTTTAPGYTWATGPDTVLSTALGTDQWPLTATSSNNNTATDSSGLNPATIVGTAAWEADHKSTTDAALTLNGNTYLKTATASVDTSQSYSVSAWAKISNLNGYQTFVTQNANTRGAYYLQYSQAFNAWTFVSPSTDNISPSTYYAAHASAPPQTGQWTHLVATYDATTHAMTLYVNGQYAGAGTNPTPWNATGPITIGANATSQYPVDNKTVGAVSDVRTFPYALTPSQVTALYSS